MATSYQGRYCGVCDCVLQAGYFSLSKRSQILTGSQPGVVMVSGDEPVTDFCGRECSGAAITSTLTSDYPTDGKSAPCLLCLRAADRTTLHVSVAMSGSGTFLQITRAAPSSSRRNACLPNAASAGFFRMDLNQSVFMRVTAQCG
jgi:hypothetical protein